MRTIFVATERTLIDTVTFTGVSAYVENCTARCKTERMNTVRDLNEVIVTLEKPITQIGCQSTLVTNTPMHKEK